MSLSQAIGELLGYWYKIAPYRVFTTHPDYGMKYTISIWKELISPLEHHSQDQPQNKVNISHLQFRTELAKVLTTFGDRNSIQNRAKRGGPSKDPLPETMQKKPRGQQPALETRLDGIGYWVMHSNKRHRCRLENCTGKNLGSQCVMIREADANELNVEIKPLDKPVQIRGFGERAITPIGQFNALLKVDQARAEIELYQISLKKYDQ
ncbi:hypothetical protein QE152_g29646 [Popillia japonica]|uniref:Uncharacterized protein n=1 Tax=Popillia japonica TaxID=7064 RepID=A0AAW1JGB7_POPJA